VVVLCAREVGDVHVGWVDSVRCGDKDKKTEVKGHDMTRPGAAVLCCAVLSCNVCMWVVGISECVC
jgi:hypothetical protein